jgi:hypothetical protein
MTILNNEHYIFKLTTGEELITRVLDASSTTQLTIKTPIQLMMGQNGINLIPSLFGSAQNSDVTLFHSAIALIAIPNKQLVDEYVKATSGLIV